MNILDQDYDTIAEFMVITGMDHKEIIAEYKTIKEDDSIPCAQKPLRFWNAMEIALDSAEYEFNENPGDPEDGAECADAANGRM